MPEFFWGDPSDYKESEVKTIDPYEVVYDPDIYPRELVGDDRVEKYENLMEDGHDFPPIKLERGSNRLLDGKARLEAAKDLGRDIEYVTVDIEDQDPTLVSAWFNAKHGESLSTEEKKDLVSQSVFDGMDDPIQLSALLSTPQRTMTNWVSQFKKAREEKKLEQVKELVKQGETEEKISNEVGWGVDKVEKIKDKLMGQVKGGEESEEDEEGEESESTDTDLHSSISSEWETETETEEESRDKISVSCKFCGASKFRIEDKAGTCEVEVKNGEGTATKANDKGPASGHYVTCVMCGETLETHNDEASFIKGTSLYEKLIDITEGLHVPSEEEETKVTGVSDSEEPQPTEDEEQVEDGTDTVEDVSVDDRDIFASYNRSPLGIDYWTTDEMSLNLLYHFSNSGDVVLELFNRDNSILDFGDEMGRNVIAYGSDPDRDDVRRWDSSEFVNDVNSASMEYAFTYIDRRFLDEGSLKKVLKHVASTSKRVVIYSDLEFKDMCELKVELTSKYEVEHRIAIVSNKMRKPEYRGDIESGYYRELFVLNTQ